MVDTVISKLCRIPIAFHERGDVSVIQLLAEAGYVVNPHAVTTEAIENYLRAHPELVDAWLGYSEDQRCSPTYYLDIRSANSPGTQCAVVYYDATIRRSEPMADRFVACAVFIKELAERWRS